MPFDGDPKKFQPAVADPANPTPKQLLLAGADLIERTGHEPDWWASNFSGARVEPYDDGAANFCVLGSMIAVLGGFDAMPAFTRAKRMLDCAAAWQGMSNTVTINSDLDQAGAVKFMRDVAAKMKG